MAPTVVFGVRAQIRQAIGLPEGCGALHAAKLMSDPNNQLLPEGAAAPVSRQSRIRGPCLKRDGTLANARILCVRRFPVEGCTRGRGGLRVKSGVHAQRRNIHFFF